MSDAGVNALDQDTRWYPTAVDWWLRVLLIVLPLVTGAGLVIAIIDGEGVWSAAIALAIVLGIYAAFLFPVRYGLTDMELVVHFGLVRQRIPYDRIQAVTPTRNPLSSPALSLRRLQVTYGAGFRNSQRISPADRDGFLDELARRAGMRRVGDRLER